MININDLIFYVLFIFGFVASIAYYNSLGKMLDYLQKNHKEKISKFNLSTEKNPKGMSFKDIRSMSKLLKDSEYFNDVFVKKIKEKTILYDKSYKIILVLWIIYIIVSILQKNN